jgi:RNA polymerase sigma-70 factor, ECF subfamily
MLQPASDSTPSIMAGDRAFAGVVEQARAGDSLAFDTLFYHYNARICTYLSRMVGNDEEGRDLARETFLKAWRTLACIQDASRFGPWLYRIATNVAIDHLRNQKFRWLLWKDSHTYESAESRHTGDSPEEHIVQVEQIKQALAELSSKYRACLLLQIEGGFSQREIAELLSMSEKNVSVYVRRGCEQFRRAYERLEHSQDTTRKEN